MIETKWKVDLSPLKGLKQSLVNKIMRPAIRKASRPMLQAAKANARQHMRTGHTVKSLSMKVKTYKSGVASIIGPKSNYNVVVGVRIRGKHKGQPIRHRPSWTLHFIEKKYGVLKPALSSEGSNFQQILTREIAAGIARELR